jgi:hypothetical protein
MISLTHFFSFALHRLSATARAMARVGKGESEKGKVGSGGGLGDDERAKMAIKRLKATMMNVVMMVTVRWGPKVNIRYSSQISSRKEMIALYTLYL